MSAVLVVNADDFGLTEGTNRAILDAHHSGIVTSTSLLANGGAFDHAVALARECPSLGVGVHLTLTEGSPLAGEQPGLPLLGGEFPLSNQPYARALLRGRLPRAAICREFEAQLQAVIAAGIQPTHLDGHKYIHLLPGIAGLVADLGRDYGIPVLRIPRRLADPLIGSPARRLPGAAAIWTMGRLASWEARRAGRRTVDRFAGFAATGHLDEAVLRRLLLPARAGVTELLCHPAYPSPALDDLLRRGYTWIAGYEFARETAAVSSATLRRDLLAAGWSLRSFGALDD